MLLEPHYQRDPPDKIEVGQNIRQTGGLGLKRMESPCKEWCIALKSLSLTIIALRSFNDAVVAFRAGAECLKRLLVSLAFMSRQRDVIAVEFDNDSPLL